MMHDDALILQEILRGYALPLHGYHGVVHWARVLENGADFLVTSVGAFTDTALFDRLLAAAKASSRRLILPSAGIGALDILSSAAVGGLESVTVTVRKDPSAWKGTIAETLVDLEVKCTNQNGQDTLQGSATVALN